jgi:chromosomal replication initiator protein
VARNTTFQETTIAQGEAIHHSQNNKNELETLNNEILNYLKTTISSEKFNAFFENLETKSLTQTQIEFSTPTPFIKTMITEYFSPFLDEAIQHNLGKPYKIIINTQKHGIVKKDAPTFFINEEKTHPGKNIVSKATKQNSRPTPIDTSFERNFHLDLIPTKEDLLSKVESKYIDHMQPDQHGILIDPNKTFENFIIGPSNNIACATAKAVSSNPGKSGKYPSLYFYSNSGLGKTHLLHSVANAIKNQHPRLRICLITARDFMNEMINAIQNNNIANFRKKYSEKIDVLMIDDIHELKDKQGTQNEFFHIFNELHDKGKQLIFTSDKSPKEIAGIEERIKTRLQWGLVIDIQKPDLETKIAILKRKAYELDLYCTEDVITLIASSIKSSIRELEGALVKLSAFSDVMKMEIDTDIVKEQLNLKGADKRPTDLEDIAKAVSQYFKIPLADLKSKARSKEITRVRHIAMYLSRKIVKSTQQEVGYFYGGRDHTSVIHAVNKISQQSKKEPYLANTILEIQNLL